MTAAVTAVNVAMGLAYLAVGAAVAWDLHRDRHAEGRRLGYAIVLMAATCGPHHIEHGAHLWAGGKAAAGWLELAVVTIGLPAGGIYAWLAFERLRGGAGDRVIVGTPRWLAGLTLAGVAYIIVVGAIVIDRLGAVGTWDRVLVPNALLVGVYLAVGVVLLSTQIVRRPLVGSWSLAGLSLGMVFPTCAVMHATWVLQGATGVYAGDVHLLFIDWISVPAGLYFLYVVADLRRQAAADWEAETLGATVPA